MRLTFYKRQRHDFIYTTRENIITRWYPWGIQRLVSTYSYHHVMERGWGGFGGMGVLESQNPKCQDLPKFQLGGGGGDLESQNPKCQDLPKFQWGEGGG